MKPVTGRVVSSKTISLSKATRVLARFVSTDTGSSSSSQAVSAYLKRVSFSFNDLLKFHSDLKSSQFPSKSRTAKKWNTTETVDARDDGILDSFDGGRKRDGRKEGRSGAHVSVDDGYERSKRKRGENVEAGDRLDNGNEYSSGAKRKRKKKTVDY